MGAVLHAGLRLTALLIRALRGHTLNQPSHGKHAEGVVLAPRARRFLLAGKAGDAAEGLRLAEGDHGLARPAAQQFAEFVNGVVVNAGCQADDIDEGCFGVSGRASPSPVGEAQFCSGLRFHPSRVRMQIHNAVGDGCSPGGLGMINFPVEHPAGLL